jgi:RNA polymerase sigma-70 factor (ECF subfamily)
VLLRFIVSAGLGDRRAALLREVHDAHGPALRRYVRFLSGGDLQFAEDVVQEALLRLWRHPEVLEGPVESARAWLFTVVRNLVIDDRRSARFARELSLDVVPDRPSGDDISRACDNAVITDALMSLSIEHRSAIVRAHYLRQTVAEIARHEQVAEGTVKSRLHYGLRALRQALLEVGWC